MSKESEDEESLLCVFITAIPYKTRKYYKCAGCENNPEFYVKDPDLLKKLRKHPAIEAMRSQV